MSDIQAAKDWVEAVDYVGRLQEAHLAGQKHAENAIAHLLETQAEMWAPEKAAEWLQGMAKIIRDGSYG